MKNIYLPTSAAGIARRHPVESPPTLKVESPKKSSVNDKYEFQEPGGINDGTYRTIFTQRRPVHKQTLSIEKPSSVQKELNKSDLEFSNLKKDLFTEETWEAAENFFVRYICLERDKGSGFLGRILWKSKNAFKHLTVCGYARRDAFLLQTFKSIGAEQAVGLACALGLHASRYFNRQDAVDFMLLLAEQLSLVSEFFSNECHKYMEFAVQMEVDAGSYRRLPSHLGEEMYNLNLFVPVSVRGRLASLIAAKADEECKLGHLLTLRSEQRKKYTAVARIHCERLFEQPWLSFDAEPYLSMRC